MEAGLYCSLWKPWGKKSLIHVICHVRALQGRFLQGGTVRRKSMLFIHNKLASALVTHSSTQACKDLVWLQHGA